MKIVTDILHLPQHTAHGEMKMREDENNDDDDDDAFFILISMDSYDTNRDFCFVGPRKSEKPTSRVSCIIEAILVTSCGSRCQYTFFIPG